MRNKIKVIKLILFYVCIVTICTVYNRRSVLLEFVDFSENEAGQGREFASDSFEDMMKRVESVQMKRIAQLRETCSNLGYSRPTPNEQLKAVRPLIVYEPHQALICLMAKVASTSWKVELGLLSNLTNTDRNSVSHSNTSWWHRVYSMKILNSYGIFPPKDYAENERLYRINNYYKFMFTRHPLERQVSAYRSKFIIGNDATYSMFYSIVRGHKPPSRFNGTSDVSFEEFITYVVNRLLKKLSVNEHMDTYEHLCSPCVINYTFIGDMGSMKDDVSYVITKMTGHKYTEHMFSMYSPEKTHESEKVYLNFYRNLDKDLVLKIDKAFENDYKLFSYKSLWTLLGYDKS